MSTLRPALRWSMRALWLTLRVAAGIAGAALTVGMGAIALLPQLDARAMIVTSGSMEPTINVGGLVIVEEVDPRAVTAGDVITFNGYSSENLTTHRVIDRKVVAGRLHFRTQGDANDTPDVDLAPGEGIVGRVRVDVPYAGRALAEVSRPELRYLALGGLSVWFVVANSLALREAVRARAVGSGDRGAARTGLCLAVAVVIVAAAAILHVDTTVAVLTDAEAVSDNAFATGTW